MSTLSTREKKIILISAEPSPEIGMFSVAMKSLTNVLLAMTQP